MNKLLIMNKSDKSKKMYKFINIKLLLILIVFLSFINTSISENLINYYEQGNKLYKAEKYDEAIKLYQKVTNIDKNNYEVCYNIANCYYRLDEVGNAILYYEKALKLKPNDEDIKFNLNIANLKVIDKFSTKEQLEIIVYYNNFVNNLHSNTWLYLSILMLLILLYVLYYYLYIKDNFKRTISIILLVFVFIFFISFTFFSYTTYKENAFHNYAILTSSNSFIKSSPETNGKNLIMIHEGLKLEILDKNENWTKVKLPDGNIGWLESSQISNI